MKYVKTLPSRKDGSCILPETRRDMAAEMGVHEKALLRELRLLQEEGIIALDGAGSKCCATTRYAGRHERDFDGHDQNHARAVCRRAEARIVSAEQGLPFTIDNPITELVTFDDVVQFRGLDKQAFLAEFEAYKTA